MSARLGLSLAAGLLASLLFLSLVRGMDNGMLLGFLAPFPLMMAALGLGRSATLGAILVGCVAVGLVSDWDFALSFAALAGVPALVVAVRALLARPGASGGTEWYPAGRILAWLVVAVLAIFAAVAAILPHHPDGARGWSADLLGQVIDSLGQPVPEEKRRRAIDLVSAILPAMAMTGWLVMAVVNAILAQALLKRLGRALRPNPAYLEFDVPDWVAGALVAAALVGATTDGSLGYGAINLAGVLLFPFALLGVATAHQAILRRPGAKAGLVALYGLLIVTAIWSLIPAAVVGLIRFLQTRVRRRDVSVGGKEK